MTSSCRRIFCVPILHTEQTGEIFMNQSEKRIESGLSGNSMNIYSIKRTENRTDTGRELIFMHEMFCFQCQQTAHNTGCEGKAGVCGKKSDTANFQDDLTGALIGLARAVNEKKSTKASDELVLKGLFTTITNVNFYNDTINR